MKSAKQRHPDGRSIRISNVVARILPMAAVAILGLLSTSSTSAAEKPPKTTEKYYVSPATEEATKDKPYKFEMFPANGAKTVIKAFPIEKYQGGNDPKAWAAASKKKAETLKKVIDNEALPGVTTKVIERPWWIPVPQLVWTPWGWRPGTGRAKTTIYGLQVDGIDKPSNCTDDVTKQINQAHRLTTTTTTGGSLDTMKNSSGDSGPDYATGLDGNGDPSIVTFGIVDNGSSIGTPYVVAISPGPGETPQEIMIQLRDAFNHWFASAGYTATYYPPDRLTIDQIVPWGQDFVFGNSDAGVNFDFEMVTASELDQ